MRIKSVRYLVFLMIIAIPWSCQKEVSFQNDIDTPGGGGNGGVDSTANPGWSFTGVGNTNYYGCVDTAYYETVSGFKTLLIEVTDSASNSFSIAIAAQGKITTTTYTPVQGATIIFTSHTGSSYISGLASSFSFKVTSINDTLIMADFSANLTDPFGSGSFTITNGKLKALIGKHNECSFDDPIDPTPGGGAGANYYLVDGAGDCSNPELQGKYIKDSSLTAEHKVELEVWVDKEGEWSASTTTVNGMKFSGSGAFTSTGNNTIVLQATGKPIATGSFEIPVTAGGSNCAFTVEVDTLGVAPCNPENNSFDFETAGIFDGGFSYVGSRLISGHYEIAGNGNSGDMRVWFPGNEQPKVGVYYIKFIGESMIYGEAAVSITSSNIYWQPHDGKLYVSIINGKAVVTFCDVEFSGTLGGPSYKSKVSAKITER